MSFSRARPTGCGRAVSRRSVQTIGGENEQRQHQMRRQPILRDLGPLREAGGDHPPADRALQRAEAEDQPQPPLQLGTQHAAPQEEQERQQIDRADHAPEQPVAPFPPEDGLEFRKAHAGVEFAILRDGLVALERLRPLRLRQRRQRAGDRLPLDDRQAGFREPRGAADQHHDRDQGGDRKQPPSDGAACGASLCGTSGHKTRLESCRKALIGLPRPL